MRELDVRPYRAGDEWLITPVEEMSFLLRSHPQYGEKWREIVKPERTWTGVLNGCVTAMGGVTEEGMVWIMLDRYSIRHKIAIMRMLKKGFEKVKNYNGFTKFFTYVKKDVDTIEGAFARHFDFRVVREEKFGDFTYLVYEWQKQQH